MQNKINIADMIGGAVKRELAELEKNPKPRFEPVPEDMFIAASLDAWVNMALGAGVEHVSANRITTFMVEDILRFDQQILDVDERLDKGSSELQEIADQHINECKPFMFRWDCCAAESLKCRMSHPGSAYPVMKDYKSLWDMLVRPDDSRAFDLIYEYPAERIPVFLRPWVTALYHDGYPVEFRVFVKDGKVLGVANYYLQMSLPCTGKMLAYGRRAAEYAQKMVNHAKSLGLAPYIPGRAVEEQRKFSATLDFIVTPDGQMLFLEGGPGYGSGAHPCSFLSNSSNRPVLPMEGMLALGQGQLLALS
jgi:hypothetical protein